MLGVAIASAMLLDMVMLSTGLRESFRRLLVARGFELRLSPRGTLPFDSEATIAGGEELAAIVRGHPDVEAVSLVLGGTLHVPGRERTVSTFALGIVPQVQGDYELLGGSDPTDPGLLVANDEFLHVTGSQVGDTLDVSAGYDPQLRAFAGTRRLVVSGRARFVYLSAGQSAVALPLRTLQEMTGAAADDRVSLVMVRVRDRADAARVGDWIEARSRRVQAVSTAEALETVDERLSYFRQLAYILGAVSLVVGFLLVVTLVTVSVNERLGEIAMLRAIGVSRWHVVQQIVIEGVVLMLAGAAFGLLLGLITARYLNAILSRFPGLPTAIDFFLFQPRAVWTALGLLVISGIAAGVWPAWRAASLSIARTLREEAVA